MLDPSFIGLTRKELTAWDIAKFVVAAAEEDRSALAPYIAQSRAIEAKLGKAPTTRTPSTSQLT